MIAVGVDPGVTGTALALVTPEQILRVAYVQNKGDGLPEQTKLHMLRLLHPAVESFCSSHVDIFVVEGQQNYRKSGNAKVEGLFDLAQVAGGIASLAIVAGSSDMKVRIPLPAEWKKQVPKDVHHARILHRYGIAFSKGGGEDPYCYPSGCAVAAKIKGAAMLNKSDWKHVCDAVGLAAWGLDMLRR